MHTRDSIVAIGFNVRATGFTRVMREILGGLGGHYDCHWIGIGYKGAVIEGPVTLYPCNLNGGDVYGALQAEKLIADLRPRFVLLLNDFWQFASYRRALSGFRGETELVGYTPVDGRIEDPSLVEPLEYLDRLVTFTEFGRRELEGAAAQVCAGRPDFRFPRVDVVPHGVDVETFHPWPGARGGQESETDGEPFCPDRRLAAKRHVFAQEFDSPELVDSFVVLNANRPNHRKRIDLTIEAFALFARGKPANVRLCLHHAVLDANQRQEILALARRSDIAERLILTKVVSVADRLRDEDLNKLYSACDVGINTAGGEGWGLISFEHAATGAAQIVPRHTALTELWQGSAEMLDPVAERVPHYSRLGHAEVSAEDAAAALERLYRDPRHLRDLSVAAYRNAHEPKYRWQSIATAWLQLLGQAAPSLVCAGLAAQYSSRILAYAFTVL